tara:strand:+ start:223 stop:588 length:366 start_codon:yes stop_codon:yes gene_type:complete
MAKLIILPAHFDERGSLTTIEKCLPFDINRVYFINDIKGNSRGGHRHKTCWQALISVSGSCKVYCNNGLQKEIFIMDSPQKCLLLKPEDWHEMLNFNENNILLVLASHHYDINDYIYEDYQ